MKIDKRAQLGDKILNLKATGQSENVNSDGGYTVSDELVPSILAPDFAEGSLYADCNIFNVGPKSNTLKIPVANESTRSSSTIKGGIRAYIVGEAATKTASKATFDILRLPLKKAATIVYVTDELMQDNVGIASYISKAQKEATLALVDYNIVYGDGSLCNGIASSPATGFVSISSPITAGELKDIFDKYYGGKNGKWYISKDLFNEIGDLYETASAGSIPLTATENGWILWGLPVIISDVLTDRTILLADLSQYAVAQKDLVEDVNKSLKWVEDETCLRTVFRINGGSLWVSPITLADGTVVHPFVMNAGLENSSSSSSSSSYIENHSTSSHSTSSTSSSSYIKLRSTSSATSTSSSSSSSL